MECCTKSLRDNVLTCSNCKLSFHCKCLNISAANYNKAKKSLWKCPKCSTPRGKRGDETPVSSALTERDDAQSSDEELLIDELCSQQTNITTDSIKYLFNNFLQKVKANMDTIKTEILERVASSQKELSEELNVISGRFVAIQEKQEVLESSLNNLSGFYDQLSQQNKSLAIENNHLKSRIAELTRSTSDMAQQINDAQRYITSKFIEIRNVPHNTDENLLDYFNKLCNALNIDYKPNFICNIYRKRTFKKDSQHILIEFNSESYRQNVLFAVKQHVKQNKEKLSTKHVGMHGELKNIYISELLSQKTKFIYYKSRQFAKTHKYEYCWVKNGMIYLRKHKTEPAILVRSELQLTELASPLRPVDSERAPPAPPTPSGDLPAHAHAQETRAPSRRAKLPTK